ncbi:radical SAM family heme chaperone HemW [Crocosphaera sp. UHCC 0190]|uniref:radical SAM family heme chaperone HemW n=1 Tax=Crocosphaera sp. UHCC 0190 TaxID=3110246 RepID=UPI002B2078A8|nr:radical SAM family heme chaperone HemW [Crocosphaera sp. UHCC 0190]MEA5508395.1 radical SAM family heme chaperone HemW [Crocosphaera sp. UHCC 0190]
METMIPSSAYLHIPFCRRRCYYCDFPISVLGDKTDINTSLSIQNYVDILCQEIQVTPSYNVPLKTVFFGGGTPSLLSPVYLEKILTTLAQHFGISSDAEISLEMDPGTFTLQQLQSYKNLGVNRFSLGIQVFQDELLEKCGRFHRLKDIENAINLIHQVNIDNFSLDLISGLPYQTLEAWQFSLEKAIEINPKHLSCYDLVLEPVTAFGKQYKPGKFPLPQDEIAAQMYRLTQQILTNAGYEHYEISNYAKSGYQCLHNRVYWENKPYYAFGMGAASYTNQQRFTRPRTRQTYYDWVEELLKSNYFIDSPYLTNIDHLLETFMLGLRLSDGVDSSKIVAQFGKEIMPRIYQKLCPYIQQQWVELIDTNGHIISNINDNKWGELTKIRLTDPDGFLVSNTILATLFEEFESDSKQ